MRTLSTLLLIAALGADLPAQTAQATRVHAHYGQERLTNPTKKGSRSILILVAYPAHADKTPIRKPGGYPVIVGLHGAGVRSGVLWNHAKRFIRSGYIVVAPEGGNLDPSLQARNALALPEALETLNKDKESPFCGMFDLSRMGICGHSMGGGNTVRVLASQKRSKAKHVYRAGFCLAPWDGHTLSWTGSPYIQRFARRVEVPLGIVHGAGDLVLPVTRCALGYYKAMKGKTKASKLLYVLNGACDHHNVGNPWGRTRGPANKAIFEFCSQLAIAFFDAKVRGKKRHLENLIKKPNPWRHQVFRDPGS